MRAERLAIGRLPGQGRKEWTWRLTLLGTGLVSLGILGWEWVTDPSTHPYIIGMPVGILAIFLSVLHLDTWLDTELGGLRHRRAWLVRWRLRWADATELRLRHNHLGLVMLQLRGRSRWGTVYVPIVADDQRGARSQPPDLLRLLAGEIRHWAAPHHHGVADELDEQAAHLERCGGVLDSPVLVRHAGWRIPV